MPFDVERYLWITFNTMKLRKIMNTNLKDRYATYVVHLNGSGLPVKPFSQWLICYS